MKRNGLLAAGSWIVDQVKMVDVFPQRETLAHILSQSEGTGGSPYNVLINLAKLGAKFPMRAAGLAPQQGRRPTVWVIVEKPHPVKKSSS